MHSTLGCHRDGRALAVNHMLPSNQIESESRYGFKGRSWVTTTFRGMCCGKILYLFFLARVSQHAITENAKECDLLLRIMLLL